MHGHAHTHTHTNKYNSKSEKISGLHECQKSEHDVMLQFCKLLAQGKLSEVYKGSFYIVS